MRSLLLLTLLLASACASGPPMPPLPTVVPPEPGWKATMPDVVQAPLVTDGTRVFAITRGGDLRALDAMTGAVAWGGGGRRGVLGMGADMVLVRGPLGTVSALDAATGTPRWSEETPVKGSLPPLVTADAVFVAGQGLTALATQDGHALWTVAEAHVTAPLALGGACLLVAEDAVLRCREPKTGKITWSLATGQPLLAAPIVDDEGRGLMGTTDGRFVGFSMDKGSLKWRWRLGADVPAAGIVLRDRVLFTSYEDVLFSLNRGNGNMGWRTPLPSRPLGPPLLFGSAVLVACLEDQVLAFDARTGKKWGTINATSPLVAPPILIQDRLVLALRDKTVTSMRLLTVPPSPSPTPDPSASPGVPPSPGAAAPAGTPSSPAPGSAPPAPPGAPPLPSPSPS